MKKREEIAKELNISRKTLYNYMQHLNIQDLNERNIEKLKSYSLNKNKSKDISKEELFLQIEELKKINSQLTNFNTELTSKNEKLEESQTVLLNQIEWYRNTIDTDIKVLKENITLLLAPPKPVKKSLISRIFKK